MIAHFLGQRESFSNLVQLLNDRGNVLYIIIRLVISICFSVSAFLKKEILTTGKNLRDEILMLHEPKPLNFVALRLELALHASAIDSQLNIDNS